MNIYPYVDKTRANADGTFPVYIIVKTASGRFFVNTSITTCDRLDGREFPKKERNRSQKTALLAKYLVEVEQVCLRQSLVDADNKTLKKAIQEEVFGVVRQQKAEYLKDYVSEFAATKRSSTAVLYGITARKVEAYDGRITADKVTPQWLEEFRQHCIDSGMAINGAAKELRNIRAVFNWARRDGRISNYPFANYSIVEEETIPNDMTTEDIRRLRDHPCEPWQKKYVDFFMLSFYLAGINPVDLLTMRKDAVQNGHISFVRQKTNKDGAKKIRTIVLPLVDEALDIIERYPSKDGFLLSFMDGRADYHSFVKKCNEALKKVGTKELVQDKANRYRKLKYHPLFPKITLYTARYSFGSIAANELDISEQTIGQCLGHSWSKHVTARYIAHDQRKIDNAVRKVVEYVAQYVTEP